MRAPGLKPGEQLLQKPVAGVARAARGLKRVGRGGRGQQRGRAHAGAWIETSWASGDRLAPRRVPFAGAWIEAWRSTGERTAPPTPLAARGLKHIPQPKRTLYLVAAHAGAAGRISCSMSSCSTQRADQKKGRSRTAYLRAKHVGSARRRSITDDFDTEYRNAVHRN